MSRASAVVSLVDVDGFLRLKLISVRLMDAMESSVLKTSNKFYVPCAGVPQRRPIHGPLLTEKAICASPPGGAPCHFLILPLGPWNGGQMEAIIDYDRKYPLVFIAKFKAWLAIWA